MKKKINAKFVWISALAILLTGVGAMILFYNILKNEIFDDLQANARVIEALWTDEKPFAYSSRMGDDVIRITLIAADGTVIFDSHGDSGQMENHIQREEVLEALEKGEGRDMRKSATFSEHMFYYAMKLEDGNIMRISKASDSINQFVSYLIGMIFLICVAVFIICVMMGKHLTARLVAPIELLADNIVLVEEESLYEELRPFVSMIKQQHMDILEHAKIRQEFTANVSHELKTPLTAISGYAELIENGMTSGENTLHFAGEIHHSAERLQRLINDIIKLSELDSEDMKLEFETIDLYDLAAHCVEVMELPAQKHDVNIRLEGEHAKVSASRTLMEELVFNLCSNAIRYNKKEGSVVVTVKQEQDQVMLIVKDTGIGIPKEHQERIFERFYRVDKSRSKSTGGTGLGLAIVKHIVAQHNAQIFLESEENVGTEIRVVL